MSAADEQALYRQALMTAVADARERAQALAAAAGVSLGRVTAIVEGGGSGPVVFADAAKAVESATPIEPGKREVSAQATVTFDLS
jgi:uncharacterized protein YggE